MNSELLPILGLDSVAIIYDYGREKYTSTQSVELVFNNQQSADAFFRSLKALPFGVIPPQPVKSTNQTKYKVSMHLNMGQTNMGLRADFILNDLKSKYQLPDNLHVRYPIPGKMWDDDDAWNSVIIPMDASDRVSRKLTDFLQEHAKQTDNKIVGLNSITIGFNDLDQDGTKDHLESVYLVFADEHTANAFVLSIESNSMRNFDIANMISMPVPGKITQYKVHLHPDTRIPPDKPRWDPNIKADAIIRFLKDQYTLPEYLGIEWGFMSPGGLITIQIPQEIATDDFLKQNLSQFLTYLQSETANIIKELTGLDCTVAFTKGNAKDVVITRPDSEDIKRLMHRLLALAKTANMLDQFKFKPMIDVAGQSRKDCIQLTTETDLFTLTTTLFASIQKIESNTPSPI